MGYHSGRMRAPTLLPRLKFQKLRDRWPALRQPAPDNQRRDKHVESHWALYSDGGSTPPISTKNGSLRARFSFEEMGGVSGGLPPLFYYPTPAPPEGGGRRRSGGACGILKTRQTAAKQWVRDCFEKPMNLRQGLESGAGARTYARKTSSEGYGLRLFGGNDWATRGRVGRGI